MNDRKIVLITGATSGIGKAAAIAMAKSNYIVVIHGRNQEKTIQVCEEIRSISANKDVNFVIGDLLLMNDVKKVAETFISRYGKLDVLINNAGGIMNKEREITIEGFEKTLAINLLAPFLLTKLLLDPLKQSEDGRIINVSSDAHKLAAKPDFDDLGMTKNYTPLTAYGNAKLFLIWITQHLSNELKQLDAHNLTVNTLHPGAVATSFGVKSNLGVFFNIIAKLARPFLKTAEQGAETMLYLATSNEMKNISGKYFVNKKQAIVSNKYYSQKHEELIWNYCVEKTKNWL
ncbi:MAG: SDR family NAD(P)-dependent oxidoreductase [Flavipsychrobacter sp.]|nr:SDR family NAD(P)-dependent oxidoreductase [Flavipsychrobacter sp.]